MIYKVTVTHELNGDPPLGHLICNPSDGSKPQYTIMLFHGALSGVLDWKAHIEKMEFPVPVRVVAVQAPMTHSFSFRGKEKDMATNWCDIKTLGWKKAETYGDIWAAFDDQEGLMKNIEIVKELIEKERQILPDNGDKRIFLHGFSMGSIMVHAVNLYTDYNFAGIIA